jgi:hypothetical protein
VLLGIILRFPHPQPARMDPLGTPRLWIAVATLVVYALCFWPFPITIK